MQLLTTKLDAMVCQHEFVAEDLRARLRAADAEKASALALVTRKEAEVAEVRLCAKWWGGGMRNAVCCERVSVCVGVGVPSSTA